MDVKLVGFSGGLSFLIGEVRDLLEARERRLTLQNRRYRGALAHRHQRLMGDRGRSAAS